MSLKEKDLEAVTKERISSSETRKNGGLDVQDVLDHSGPVAGHDEREDKETRRIIRKIDMRLLLTLAVIYAFALIDRVNLPNARIAGMDTDLQLSFPANIIIRKAGPTTLVVCWGAVTIGMGFTSDWTQALECRIILGVLEAGYYPGCVFLLSCWYVRFEVQKRFSGFYLLALPASGFSNTLAWGVSEMKGLSGLNGW
ncbi:hypothetical protein EK21DRAFT_114462 [Setomelanomma holmii]|uniref:Uncharacterized protein n=1 Tax=Setomelanomma holmii TaxID=210430 RepID=A0A9P4LKP5_9PLEO|nr:hypothetical protein EK21DRAFT_114462 [Setomelanomma holmii]